MPHTALLTSIQAELELFEHFFFTLEKEHETLLSSYSNDELFDLTEMKNQYATRLDEIAVTRDQQLNELNLDSGRAGLLQAKALSPDIAHTVTTLFNLAEKARVLNEKNGVLIQAYLTYTSEALAAFGKSAEAPKQDVYDAQGKKQSALASNKRGYIRA